MTLAEFNELQAKTQSTLDELLRAWRSTHPDRRETESLRRTFELQCDLSLAAQELADIVGRVCANTNAAYADQVLAGEPAAPVHFIAPQSKRLN